MDLLGDPLTICPIQTSWEICIEPYPNWQFGCVDNPDRQFGTGSVLTRTRTRSDGPEPLLTLTIPNNFTDRRDYNSESDDKPLRRLSRKAMGTRSSKDSFMSILGKRVAPTQLTPTSAQPLNLGHLEVYIVSEEEDECDPALLESKNVSN
jgi:hypothetical protein